jgi:hypothetical protein
VIIATDEADPWPTVRHNLGPACVLLAAFLAVVVFLPPEGRIMAPLHEALLMLFGRATFMVPLGLAFVGGLLLITRVRPDVRVPGRRVAGVGLIAVVARASENLLANGTGGTGRVGEWLSGGLLDLLGGPITIMLLVSLLAAGTLLAFDVKWPKVAKQAPGAES